MKTFKCPFPIDAQNIHTARNNIYFFFLDVVIHQYFLFVFMQRKT